MYENRPNETKYIYTDDDNQGKQLSGQNTYSITFAKGEVPPVKGFWSLTLYDAEHFFHPNALKRYSLRLARLILSSQRFSRAWCYSAETPPRRTAIKSPKAQSKSVWSARPPIHGGHSEGDHWDGDPETCWGVN